MTLKLNGSSSGYTAIDAPATAGSNTLVLPPNNGSANQILQTDGSGNLTWVDKPTATGWTKIATNTHSDVAQIDIEDTAAFDGTYDYIRINFFNVRPANDSQMLLWRIKQGGSYVTSSDYKSHSEVLYSNTSTVTHELADNLTAGEWTTGTIGNYSTDSFNAYWEFADPTQTSYHPAFSWRGWGQNNTGNSMLVNGSGICKETGAVQGIRVYCVSGNISAKVTTYGLTK